MSKNDNATTIQILLQQAKINALLEEIHEDIQDLKTSNGTIEKERIQAYNNYYNEMDLIKRQQREGHNLSNEIRKTLRDIRQHCRRLAAVGIALIFGGSILSKTELFGLLSKLF